MLTITIDLGEGNQELIPVFEGDVAVDLATQFVLNHRLNMALVPLLAKQIQSNID